MTKTRGYRPRWIVASVALGLLVLAALNFEALAFGAAALFGEKRPALLSDAGWQDPPSARHFANRFLPGSAESDLLKWLLDNRFDIDRTRMKAERTVAGFPCNEAIEIIWISDGTGRIHSAVATVSEAGCL
ncbi:MAG: hypothetical protein ACOH1H_08175 [Brevundimonas sp.]